MFIKNKKNIAIYVLIFVALFLALIPVILSNNYLRQDDMKTGLWWGMKMTDEGYLYYNTMHQLVRPICMVIFFLIDMLSINMHYAVYVRLASLINIGILGILLYRWQLYFNANRVLAATFAIAAFTLPGIQLAAATANYFLMIFAILLTFGGPFYWYKSFCSDIQKEKNKYLMIGCGLFFASFLDYPISSMYAWVMLGICYLNSLTADLSESNRLKRFFYYGAFLTLSITAFYFVFMHVYHWIMHIDMSYGRVGVSDILKILSRVFWIFDILVVHALLWFEGQANLLYPLATILSLLILALFMLSFKAGENENVKNSAKNVLRGLAVLFTLFLMCYSPALAAPEDSISYTFRYTLATMPLLLYVIFWSINTITVTASKSLSLSFPQKGANIVFLATAVFAIYYANIMTADGIVGPQDNDYRFIESQLSEKVTPLLKQHKFVAVHVIDCDHGNHYQFEKGIPTAAEYSMRLCAFPHHLVGAVSHSMMVLGYLSNPHSQNDVFSDEKIFILKKVPWGNIIISSTQNYDRSHLDYPQDKMMYVTIDMNDAPPYKHLGLYKRIFKLNNA